MPARFRAAEAGGAGTRAIQCLRSSAESLQDFIDAAWTYLANLAQLQPATDVGKLYKLAARYNY